MNKKIVNIYMPKGRYLSSKLREKIKSSIPQDASINIVPNEYASICEVNFTMDTMAKYTLTIELMNHCTGKKSFLEWFKSIW